MSKICIFLFNHQYEKNIPTLKKIYGDRFSTIPFSRPSARVIIRKSFPSTKNPFIFKDTFPKLLIVCKNFDYYVFCGDDLILNPYLNEHNLIEKIGSIDSAYIKYLNPIWEHSLLGINSKSAIFSK